MKIFYLAFIDLAEESADTVHPLEVCKELVRLGHKITIITPSCKSRSLENIKIIRTKAFKIPLIKGLIHHLLLLPILFFFYLIGKIDLIYSRYHPLEILATYPIKKIFKVKYIIEVNGAGKEEMRLRGEPEWKIGLYSFLEERLLKIADRVITVTENLKDYLIKEYNLSPFKIEVISNGANVEIFHPMDKKRCRERLGIPLQSNVLCFVGSLKPWHGIENAIEILPELNKHIPNIELLIVGDGPLMKILKKRVNALSLDERVIFTGKVKREGVPFYINSADICLAPYGSQRNRVTGLSSMKIFETGLSPIKIFDYMACGKPFVTTDVGGLGDFVEKYNCGVVAPLNNLKKFTEIVISLIHNKEMQKKLGEKGRKAVVENFSWEKITKKIERVIMSLQ